MKLFESAYLKATNEYYLNILPFGNKSLLTFYKSNIDSTLASKFYFRWLFEINDGSLIWTEFIIGKFIMSFTFLHYERYWLAKWRQMEDENY